MGNHEIKVLNLDGALFGTEQVAIGGGNVHVFSLIGNRTTRFGWSEVNP